MTSKKNLKKKRMVQNRMVKKGFIGAIVLAVILFGGVILGLMCTERIPAGYVGVVYNMNGGRGRRGSTAGMAPCLSHQEGNDILNRY